MFLRRRIGLILLCSFLVAVSAASFGRVTNDGFAEADLVFVDVGQGDCMHIKTESGRNYLIDGGGSVSYNTGKKTLKPYLLKNGVKSIDGAFVTHLHTDHYQGVAELCREGMVKQLILYEGYRVREAQILEDTGLTPDDLIYLCRGEKVVLDREVSVKALWPERQHGSRYEELAAEEDENALSLILKLDYGGVTMLATGDVDADCLDRLTEHQQGRLVVDIVKAAHHGSKYSCSDAFADAAKPEFAVFQVGKNNFGHPSSEAITAWESRGAAVYRNDRDGAVGFVIEGGRIRRVVTVLS